MNQYNMSELKTAARENNIVFNNNTTKKDLCIALAGVAGKAPEVPVSMLDPISLDILNQPVLLNSGHMVSRNIYNRLSRNGTKTFKNPFTRNIERIQSTPPPTVFQMQDMIDAWKLEMGYWREDNSAEDHKEAMNDDNSDSQSNNDDDDSYYSGDDQSEDDVVFIGENIVVHSDGNCHVQFAFVENYVTYHSNIRKMIEVVNSIVKDLDHAVLPQVYYALVARRTEFLTQYHDDLHQIDSMLKDLIAKYERELNNADDVEDNLIIYRGTAFNMDSDGECVPIGITIEDVLGSCGFLFLIKVSDIILDSIDSELIPRIYSILVSRRDLRNPYLSLLDNIIAKYLVLSSGW